MNEKEFLRSLGATEKPPTMIDTQFHKLDRQRVEELRQAVLLGVNTVFDELTFDDQGDCVSPFSVDHKRDIMSLAMGSGRMAHIITKTTFSYSVEKTLEEIREQIAKAQAER